MFVLSVGVLRLLSAASATFGRMSSNEVMATPSQGRTNFGAALTMQYNTIKAYYSAKRIRGAHPGPYTVSNKNFLSLHLKQLKVVVGVRTLLPNP